MPCSAIRSQALLTGTVELAQEVLRVTSTREVLTHELGPEQYRSERPVVDHDPSRFASFVEADYHHAADGFAPHH